MGGHEEWGFCLHNKYLPPVYGVVWDGGDGERRNDSIEQNGCENWKIVLREFVTIVNVQREFVVTIAISWIEI